VLRGLVKDSAVVGTYKRLHRKPKRKSYRQESEFLYDLIMAIGKPIRERKK
jgi:hypothetical protein